MATKTKGKISVNTENLFPIIKKWLYSEHDIFLRELISNAADAITKHHHLALTGQSSHKDIKHKIEVTVDKKKKTVTISDTGLGMTEEEVTKYISQIALSSAQDFVEKFKDAGNDEQIIGHFGMGFYSAFMVAKKVELETLSCQEGAEAIKWSCDGSTEYTTESSKKKTVGTTIKLFLDKDSEEFSDDTKVRQVMERYWDYCPYTLELNGEKINIHKAIWNETPSAVKDEEYKEFYSRMNPMGGEPLFWIHLNFDLPLNLKGVLYVPKFTNETMMNKGKIRLYCNQVFVTDETQELIPPFLEMLHGSIDWPDMPLNVSRSALQNSPDVRKISARITKKVADKLNGLYKTEKENYLAYWKDIHPFVKYGSLHDKDFYEKVKNIILFTSTTEEGPTALSAYLERCKEKHEKKIYYATDLSSQSSYLDMFKTEGKEVLIMDSPIDTHFMQFIEFGEGVQFQRIDAELDDNMVEGGKDDDKKDEEKDENSNESKLQKIFADSLDNEKVTIEIKSLKSKDMPSLVILPEHMRRFNEMQMLSGNQGDRKFLDTYTFVVNSTSPVANRLISLKEAGKDTEVGLVCHHLHDLALIAQNNFNPEGMGGFVSRSNQIIGILAEA